MVGGFFLSITSSSYWCFSLHFGLPDCKFVRKFLSSIISFFLVQTVAEIKFRYFLLPTRSFSHSQLNTTTEEDHYEMLLDRSLVSTTPNLTFLTTIFVSLLVIILH